MKKFLYNLGFVCFTFGGVGLLGFSIVLPFVVKDLETYQIVGIYALTIIYISSMSQVMDKLIDGINK